VTPRVSVIVPTRDRLQQLQRALAGVAAQSFRDREVLVVDDGSTDGTRKWLSAVGYRVRLVTNAAPGGAGAARNRGIEQARGELIAFLDDDDIWRPSYLEQQVGHLDANRDASLSYADHLEIDASGRASRPDTRALMKYDTPLVRMLAESFIHTMSVVVCRRGLFEVLGPFNESLHIVQDLEWYARLLSSGERVVHLPETLVGRAVPGGLVTKHRQWLDEERRVVETVFVAGEVNTRDARLIRAYRSLFFAHLGLSKGDISFGLMRLADALLTSPSSTLSIAARRVGRRLQRPDRAGPWDAAASAVP
jgi:glycosyltransferase involved in cell wall biosynthesis